MFERIGIAQSLALAFAVSMGAVVAVAGVAIARADAVTVAAAEMGENEAERDAVATELAALQLTSFEDGAMLAARTPLSRADYLARWEGERERFLSLLAKVEAAHASGPSRDLHRELRKAWMSTKSPSAA